MHIKGALIFSCFLVVTAGSVASQTPTPVTRDELSLKVTNVLLKKNLMVLAQELSKSKANGVDDLLIRLDVFYRAGETEKIRQTIRRLSESIDLPPVSERKWLFDVVRWYIARDLTAQRAYYELLAQDDGYYSTNAFISLWQTEGDEKELENWLSKRAVIGTSWFTIDLERRLKLDRAQPILDDLAGRVRLNPGDKQAFGVYVGTVKHAQEYTRNIFPGRFENETDWLAGVFKPTGSLENYYFGKSIDEVSPLLAIKYYLDSLASTITANEIELLKQKYLVHSLRPRPIDWQKQLRYWAKQKLAAAYQRTGQATLAQPLVEELVTAKTDDIYSEENFALAGSVQVASGARAVESKVVQDEATRRNTIEYWAERINYYSGRNEIDQVIDAFHLGLENVPAANKVWFAKQIGSVCRYSLSQKEGFEQNRPRIAKVLLDAFQQIPSDSDLAFEIVNAASGEGCRLPNFREALFLRRRDVLRPLFERRSEWSSGEVDTLVEVLRDERLSPEQKQFYLSDLEKMVSRGPLERRLALARLFDRIEEHGRIIPLIISYLKQFSPTAKTEDNKRSALWSLFDAYYKTGDWRLAEKLLNENQTIFLQGWGNYLERLAICAGQQNAPQDALRLWLKAVNFNGHSKFGLINLADTSAKPLLRQYYLRMKESEPNSTIADAALRLLPQH